MPTPTPCTCADANCDAHERYRCERCGEWQSYNATDDALCLACVAVEPEPDCGASSATWRCPACRVRRAA